ncbi:MAG: hypothetical protein IPH77_11900 [Ignavibacteria bacterium]|nr:hypothetical protein [Ignavibacteria bacterium]
MIAALLAVAMNADVMMSMKEYNKYSMRGEPGIEAKIDKKVADDQPLDYQYATNWSFSPGEVITFPASIIMASAMWRYGTESQSLLGSDACSQPILMYFGVIVPILGITECLQFQKKSVRAGDDSNLGCVSFYVIRELLLITICF